MDIYAEEVMDHYEHPRNQGELMGEGVLSGAHNNASCGDMIQFYLKLESPITNNQSSNKIVDVKWKGVGCAVSTAAASKLSEWLKGQEVEKLIEMSEEELMKAVGFEVGPGREKCLRLPAHVVKELLTHTPKI